MLAYKQHIPTQIPPSHSVALPVDHWLTLGARGRTANITTSLFAILPLANDVLSSAVMNHLELTWGLVFIMIL